MERTEDINFVERPSKSIEFYFTHVVVVIITLACIFMAGPMRGGLPVEEGATVAMRFNYIQANLTVWKLGWFFWMLSALGLFFFCLSLAKRLKANVIVYFGLGVVALGFAPDLIAEVIYAFVIPSLDTSEQGLLLLQTLEQTAVHLTGFLGNGLYNLGGLLITLQLWSQVKAGILQPLPSWVIYFGLFAWLLGLSLSVSVAFGDMASAEVFTAMSMVLSTWWMLVIAYKVFK